MSWTRHVPQVGGCWSVTFADIGQGDTVTSSSASFQRSSEDDRDSCPATHGRGLSYRGPVRGRFDPLRPTCRRRSKTRAAVPAGSAQPVSNDTASGACGGTNLRLGGYLPCGSSPPATPSRPIEGAPGVAGHCSSRAPRTAACRMKRWEGSAGSCPVSWAILRSR